MDELNEQFQYNLMLAKGLIQLLQENDRQYIRIWFDLLADLDQTREQQLMRNEYIWFILLMLQNNKVEDYFKKLPPETFLPLREAIPQKTIDDVLLASEQNMSWLDMVSDDEKVKNLEKKKIPPERFFNSQPLPKDGIICYFGAFSDQQ